MLKRFKLRLGNLLVFTMILGLSGCGQNSSNMLVDDVLPIKVTLSQGKHFETVLEDSNFHTLLNTPNALDEENVPLPEVWHKVKYNTEQDMLVRVDNCAELDLLDLVVYHDLDAQGRPKSYQYVPICGVEIGEACGTSQGISANAREYLNTPGVNNFAFSGICISDDKLDARSFIAFLKKE